MSGKLHDNRGEEGFDTSMKILMPKANKQPFVGVVKKKNINGNNNSVLPYSLLAVACVTIAALCVFIANNWEAVKTVSSQSTFYKVNFLVDGRWQSDTIEYNKDNGHLRGRGDKSGESIFDWDLDTGYKAYSMQQSGFNNNKTFCLISRGKQHNSYELDGDMVVKGLTDMEGDEQVAEFDERRWQPSNKKITDTSFLPRSIKRGCKGLNMYAMEQYFSKGSEEETDYMAWKVEEKKSAGSSGVVPPGELYNSREKTDGKDCCVHCPKAYFYCQKVCIPMITFIYPYTTQNCERQVCTTVMPCSYWHDNKNKKKDTKTVVKSGYRKYGDT